MINKGHRLSSDPGCLCYYLLFERLKQNSKFDLVEWGISLLIVFADLYLKTHYY